MNQKLVSRFVIGVDVEKYSPRNVRQQDDTQRSLDRILGEAAQAAGLDRQEWMTLPGGDGELAVLPADVDVVATVSGFVGQLDDRLDGYNQDHLDVMKLRLRVAMHMDMVLRSALGYAGPGLVVLSRLLDGKEFKQAFAEARDANLALLVSEPVYRSVVESGLPGLRPGRFRSLTIDNPAKAFQQTAYLYIPGASPATAASGSKKPGHASDAQRQAPTASVIINGDVNSAGGHQYIVGRDLRIGGPADGGEAGKDG